MICMTVLVMTCALGYAAWEGRVPRPAVLRPAAGARVGADPRVLRPRPDPVLRRVRGDADPALLPDRHLGRARAPQGHAEVHHLHVRRHAADAGRDDRDRPAGRLVRPSEVGTSNSNWVFGGVHPGVRHQGAGVAAARLAARRVPQRAAGGGGACCPAWRRRPAPTASCASCCRSSRSRVSEFRWHPGRRGRDRAAVRLAARVPAARRPRRDRVLVDRPDGPRDARHLRPQRPGRHRRRVPDGQPRPAVGGAVPARRLDRAHHRPGRASRGSAASRAAGRCSRRSSSSSASRRSRCPARARSRPSSWSCWGRSRRRRRSG